MKEAQEKIKSTDYKKKPKKNTQKKNNQKKKGKIILITFIHGIKQHHLPKSGLASSSQCRIFRVTITGGSKAGEFLCRDPLLLTYVDKHRARAPLNLSKSCQERNKGMNPTFHPEPSGENCTDEAKEIMK